MWSRVWHIAMLATPVLALSPADARSPVERRCGWLDNVTPGNFGLTDADGTWTIAEQGGYQASGFERLPDMSTKGSVATNGPHGYSCACITGRIDRKSERFVAIVSGEPKPLRQCRRDPKLPKY